MPWLAEFGHSTAWRDLPKTTCLTPRPCLTRPRLFSAALLVRCG